MSGQRIYNLISIGLAIIVALLAWLFFKARPAEPMPTQRSTQSFTHQLPDNYFYRQDDPRWAQQVISETEFNLRTDGCLISSVAMAASNLLDEDITPLDLEIRLSREKGFTDRGWLIWGKLDNALDSRISGKMYNKVDHNLIDQCMAGGNYPIVKIYITGNLVHWVLIVSSTADDYYVRDPLIGGSNDTPILLSSRADKIHAIRCIVKTP